MDDSLKSFADGRERGYQESHLNAFPEPKWLPFVHIVALEREHARFLAAANRIPQKYWKHVARLEDIAGREGKVCFYYRWYELRKAEQIRDYVLTFKDRFTVIELSDEPETT